MFLVRKFNILIHKISIYDNKYLIISIKIYNMLQIMFYKSRKVDKNM